MHTLEIGRASTPKALTAQITEGCGRLVPGGHPTFVDCFPFPAAITNKCTFNVKRFLNEEPGEMVLGWQICVWDNVLLNCIGHAVVRQSDKLLCVTPSSEMDSRILFVADPRLSFDYNDPMARMPSVNIPLSPRQDVRRLIAIEHAERAIKIKYPVTSGNLYVEGVDAEVMQGLAKEKQRLTLSIILATSVPTTRCFCGSGKKFSKCHRGYIQHLFRSS